MSTKTYNLNTGLRLRVVSNDLGYSASLVHEGRIICRVGPEAFPEALAGKIAKVAASFPEAGDLVVRDMCAAKTMGTTPAGDLDGLDEDHTTAVARCNPDAAPWVPWLDAPGRSRYVAPPTRHRLADECEGAICGNAARRGVHVEPSGRHGTECYFGLGWVRGYCGEEVWDYALPCGDYPAAPVRMVAGGRAGRWA